MLTAPPAHAGNTFVYDPAGQLVAVIDGSGNAAVYNYDLAGNLQSVTNADNSQTAVYGFSPNNGPIGTSVTIYGNGFSITPSQNTVKFTNNKTATVTASTSTSITTSVPTGAVTGNVTVTTPAGSDTGSFKVTAQ